MFPADLKTKHEQMKKNITKAQTVIGRKISYCCQPFLRPANNRKLSFRRFQNMADQKMLYN